MSKETAGGRRGGSAWLWAAGLSVLLLSACGGGGSGGGDSAAGGTTPPTNGTRTPLTSLSVDELPTGERVDLRSAQYFPMNVGDTWNYELRYGNTSYTLDRTVVPRSDGLSEIQESAQGQLTSYLYRRSDAGLLFANLLGDNPPAAARALVGELLQYPEPFYAEGQTRRVVRQGSWGADTDGDGIQESLRVEFTQVYEGLQSLTLSNGRVVQAARFYNTLQLTLQPSRISEPVYQFSQNERVWWGAGSGMLRVDGDQSETGRANFTYQITLTGGTGAAANALTPGGAEGAGSQRLNLTHNALVYDSTRGQYYASVPGSVVGNGNRLAIVNAATGQVRYTNPVGSEPGALAISADGGSLYVGLNGSGEVLRLALSDFTVMSRSRLPSSASYGQTTAEQIAVSPTDAAVAAVSMAYASVSPRHAGVVLLRAGTVQPTTSQGHTGSNLIAFGADGSHLYGFNNESTEFGLRRLAVLADGVAQQQVVAANGNFATRHLSATPQGVWVGATLYSTPDLFKLGQIAAAGPCKPLPNSTRLLCLHNDYSSTLRQLLLADGSNFSLLQSTTYRASTTQGAAIDLVPGPVGQVALRFGPPYTTSAATEILLLNVQSLWATPQ